MSDYRMPEQRKLYRSRVHRKIAGVCGGLGEFFGIDPSVIRVAFVALLVLGGGGGIIYLIAALILDDNPYQ